MGFPVARHAWVTFNVCCTLYDAQRSIASNNQQRVQCPPASVPLPCSALPCPALLTCPATPCLALPCSVLPPWFFFLAVPARQRVPEAWAESELSSILGLGVYGRFTVVLRRVSTKFANLGVDRRTIVRRLTPKFRISVHAQPGSLPLPQYWSARPDLQWSYSTGALLIYKETHFWYCPLRKPVFDDFYLSVTCP